MIELSYKLSPTFSSKPHEIKNEKTGEIVGSIKRDFGSIFERIFLFHFNFTITDNNGHSIKVIEQKGKGLGLIKTWRIQNGRNKSGEITVNHKKNLKHSLETMSVKIDEKKINFSSDHLTSDLNVTLNNKTIAHGQRKGFNSYKLSVHDNQYDWKVILGSWAIFCLVLENK